MVKMVEVNKKLQALNRKKAGKVEIRTGMNTRLLELRNYQDNAKLNPKPNGPIHRVTITLKTNETISGKLDISYLVSNALTFKTVGELALTLAIALGDPRAVVANWEVHAQIDTTFTLSGTRPAHFTL